MPDDQGYGFCPWCGSPGVARDRSPTGNDTCSGGHVYPSWASKGTPRGTLGSGVVHTYSKDGKVYVEVGGKLVDIQDDDGGAAFRTKIRNGE